MGLTITRAKDVAEREGAGTDVHLKDELGAKMFADDARTLPVIVHVVGTYSTRYRDLIDAQRDQYSRRRTMPDGDELKQQALDLVAGSILGWDNLVIDGQEIPFSKSNAIALLDAAPWIKDQIDTAMSDHQRFFKPASAT